MPWLTGASMIAPTTEVVAISWEAADFLNGTENQSISSPATARDRAPETLPGRNFEARLRLQGDVFRRKRATAGRTVKLRSRYRPAKLSLLAALGIAAPSAGLLSLSL